MAYVARLSDYVRGGVVGETLQEGVPVVMTQSGVRNELPVLMKAPENSVHRVGILFATPDDFVRPTDEGLYKAGFKTQIDPNSGFGLPVQTQTLYKVGKSTLWNPTLTSGELGQMHRGGSYAVPSGAFVDSANIKVPGNMIKVGSTNKWEYTNTESEAVGMTEEYNHTLGVLIFSLWH